MNEPETKENLPKPLPSIESEEGRREIIERGRKGDGAVRWLVGDLFDRDRKLGGKLTDSYGDSYAHARRTMTKLVADNDLVIDEGLQHKIDAIRDELAGPNPTALERILCERIALCWFDAHEMDRRFNDQSGISLKVAVYRESRRDRAHKRFLAACKTLATVRKLALPAVQINLAHQQVNQMNIASSETPRST